MKPKVTPAIATAANLQQQKNYPAAERIYRQVLASQPGNPDALVLLGLLLHETGRNAEAVEPLRRSITVQGNRPEARQTLVAVLQALGRLPEAIAEAREVARIKPTDAEARYAVAQLMLQAGKPAEAIPYAQRAAELNPAAPAIFLTLSRAYLSLNDLPRSMAALDRALAIDPNFADAIIDKGHLLQLQGQIDPAISLFQIGLKLNPKNVAALNNLGSCLLMQNRHQEAIQCFESAANLWPNSAKPRNNVGAVLKEVGLIDDAIVQFHRAIAIDPKYGGAYCNLAACYATVAEHEQAIAANRDALRVEPDFAGVGSNLLMVTLSPTNLSLAEVFQEHLEWDRRHAAALRNELPPVAVEPNRNRKIRVGYISPDFREHSVRYFIEPVLAHHDRDRFEIICYATGRRRDEVTDRLVQLTDAWHSVAGLTDGQLAQLIRKHGVDILVDLAGHTSDNRLLAFARKPAPVQVAYLGYPTTTGLSAMDYRITDATCDPLGADAFYTEKLVRLPDAFFVYSDDTNKPLDPTLPADRNGFFTFGSFNAFTKMNDETLEAWASILRQVPGSRLLFKAKPVNNPSTRQKLQSFFESHGVAADRLDIRSWVPMQEHVSLLTSGIDLMLDTFPYNGHTTTCQSLWMGTAVVTRSGDSFRSRVGQTIMDHLGLSDFVARDWAGYEQIAVALATDPAPLRSLRPTLRKRFIKSPLCDAVRFTRSLEAAYLQMLQTAPA